MSWQDLGIAQADGELDEIEADIRDPARPMMRELAPSTATEVAWLHARAVREWGPSRRAAARWIAPGSAGADQKSSGRFRPFFGDFRIKLAGP